MQAEPVATLLLKQASNLQFCMPDRALSTYALTACCNRTHSLPNLDASNTLHTAEHLLSGIIKAVLLFNRCHMAIHLHFGVFVTDVSAACRSSNEPEQQAADLPAQKPGVTTSTGPQVVASFCLSVCCTRGLQPLSMPT